MRFQQWTCLLTLSLVFVSTAGLRAGSRPITLSDGSVCLSDEGQPIPETSGQEHQHPFKLATIFLERLSSASQDMKRCMPLVTKCEECVEFNESVRSVVVQFRDGNSTRNVALRFDGATIQVESVDLSFGEWQRHENASDRRKVQRVGRNTKIQWIFVDGRPFDCRTSFCRITFQNEDATQTP
jgi:hypothetical protein